MADRIAIMFSGGTDSTCAAVIMSDKFKKVDLLTFRRAGLSHIDNSVRNFDLLREKRPLTVFEHRIISSDPLARHVACKNYFSDVFKYGFFHLSNCVMCCLSHHFGTLIYALNHGVRNVADGVTRDWPFFPSHMEEVIFELRGMYREFGIEYHTPVYDFEVPSQMNLMDKLLPNQADIDPKKATTGNYLYNLGFFPSRDIKGTAEDKEMQPRCMQFILHHIYLYWYFLPRYGQERFRSVTRDFIKGKISDFTVLAKNRPERAGKLISLS